VAAKREILSASEHLSQIASCLGARTTSPRMAVGSVDGHAAGSVGQNTSDQVTGNPRAHAVTCDRAEGCDYPAGFVDVHHDAVTKLRVGVRGDWYMQQSQENVLRQ